MKNWLGLALLSLFAWACAPKTETTTERNQPNVLFIITDDQGYGDLSLHGNDIIETPAMDALGKSSTRFDRFYVSPVCAPTRAAFLTGRRPLSTNAFYVTRGGETMDSTEYTTAELLRDNGYATGYFGKWHNGGYYPYTPDGQGFEEFTGICMGHFSNYFDPTLIHNQEEKQYEGYIADIFTDEAIQFMKSQEKDKPFFCYLAYNTPHSPYQAPDSLFDYYQARVEAESQEEKAKLASVYGMIKNLDDNLDRLMTFLRESGLDENTIVVFTTDNGPNTKRYNGGMKGKKGWVTDGGIRVPFFLHWKDKVPAGKVVEEQAAHIDFFPTLMSLLGISNANLPNPLVGIDLSPAIFGNQVLPDREFYTHVNHGPALMRLPASVRNKQYRWVASNNGEELTMLSDTAELNNLADSLPDVAKGLKDKYDAWFNQFDITTPKIPVGHSKAPRVSLQAHDAYLCGGSKYRWWHKGYANDWVTSFDMDSSGMYWPIDVLSEGDYKCIVEYASEQECQVAVSSSAEELRTGGLPKFYGKQLKSYDNVNRVLEAYDQTWRKKEIGMLHLEQGIDTLRVLGDGAALEIKSLTLVLNR